MESSPIGLILWVDLWVDSIFRKRKHLQHNGFGDLFDSYLPTVRALFIGDGPPVYDGADPAAGKTARAHGSTK
jgi:hypothetical protein